MNTRNYNWTHSGLIGAAIFGRANMTRIRTARSARPEEKALALEIETKMSQLSANLARYRVNEDGSVSILREEK